jgi:hypothetical protein
MLLFSSTFYTPYLYDMAAFNLTGQGMQRNAEVGLFTKPSKLETLTKHVRRFPWILI